MNWLSDNKKSIFIFGVILFILLLQKHIFKQKIEMLQIENETLKKEVKMLDEHQAQLTKYILESNKVGG